MPRNLKIQILISLLSFLFGLYLFKGAVVGRDTRLVSTPGSVASTSPASPQPSVSQEVLAVGITEAVVTRVIDGDTIIANVSGREQTVRYIGINAPETVSPKKGVECFGRQASDENKKLVTEKRVWLEKDAEDSDKYGRLLRYVYLKIDGDNLLFVNDYLLRQGFAKIYTFPPNTKYLSRFEQAQVAAKAQNLGLWSKCGR